MKTGYNIKLEDGTTKIGVTQIIKCKDPSCDGLDLWYTDKDVSTYHPLYYHGNDKDMVQHLVITIDLLAKRIQELEDSKKDTP